MRYPNPPGNPQSSSTMRACSPMRIPSRAHTGTLPGTGGHTKAQTSIVLIVLLLIIFAALGIFLLSLARTVSQEDYMDLYANNLMLSIMKTDTGCSDSNCKLVSDTVACAFILSDWPCGDSGRTCLETANTSLSEYMSAFDLISRNYRYLFVVTSEFCSMTEEGCRVLTFGDTGLESYRGKKRVANYAIQKSMAGSQYNIKVRLYLARNT